MNLLEIALKLILAIGLGGLIGLERELSQKPAGLRTNILICLGSTMMMILSQLSLQGSNSSGDTMRVAAPLSLESALSAPGPSFKARESFTA